MPIHAYQIVISPNTPTRLSDVYGPATPGEVDPAVDIPYRSLSLQATGSAVFLGADATVSQNNYGVQIAPADPTARIGPYETGMVYLSDFWAFTTAGGDAATLHMLAIPF